METKKRKAPDDEAAIIAVAGQGEHQVLPLGTTSAAEHTGTSHHAGPDTSSDRHYRDLYSEKPDFGELARRDANFAPFVKGVSQLDFTDPAAVMQLTKTLLKADFGLKIDLPDDRLCPPIPNRHNYILWLKSLLDSTSYQPPGRSLHGLDIGTGASCIYPLLGTAQRPWRFIATDIDEKSLSYAKRNVELNGLENRIRVVERDPKDSLIPLDDLGIQSIDFAMMNPPFYTSNDQLIACAEAKSRPPLTACTGAPVEMVISGGEVAHVGRMLKESLVLRERVQWYTSMLGHVSSVVELVEQLREHKIDNYAVTEFIQGNKTKRWALGWSFGPMRPDDGAARGIREAKWKKILPPIVRFHALSLPVSSGIGPVIKRIPEVLGSLELVSWVWDAQTLRGVGRTNANVWGRAWRRMRQREMASKSTGGDAAASSKPASEDIKLGFEVLVELGIAGTSVTLRWVEGHDIKFFESLGAFLETKLKDLCG